VSFNTVAKKWFSKQSFAEDKEMMMSGVSYRGMHIPFFAEKKLAVWKYQMESIFFTIGCLGIARGDAKKKLTKQFGLSHEEILLAKCKRFNKKFMSKKETLVLTCWYSRWV
jgi:uncharacterized membrane protein YczE